VQRQALLAGQFAAQGGVENGLEGRRIVGCVSDAVLSTQARRKAQCLTSAEHREFFGTNQDRLLQTPEVLRGL
jgi:hypothetical protein